MLQGTDRITGHPRSRSGGTSLTGTHRAPPHQHCAPAKRFGLDGTEYEIDLNDEHARELREALARFVGAARRASGAARRPARTGRRAPAGGLNTTGVREWAKAQGIEVKDRGRVPAELVVKFKAATGQ